MTGVTRIGVSLEPDLLDAFDEDIAKKGYSSRSEALRDLVRDSLAENEWKNDDEWMVGTIVIVYDHTASAVGDRLTSLQHQHHGLVKTSVHIHLDENKCMEILICEEKLRNLKEFASEVTSLKGVLRGRLTMVAPSSGNLHHVGHRQRSSPGCRPSPILIPTGYPALECDLICPMDPLRAYDASTALQYALWCRCRRTMIVHVPR